MIIVDNSTNRYFMTNSSHIALQEQLTDKFDKPAYADQRELNF